MELFKGRIVLVTGAGMGEAAAVSFACAGACGVILAGQRHAELEHVADRVAEIGAIPLVVPTDVSQEAGGYMILSHRAWFSGEVHASP